MSKPLLKQTERLTFIGAGHMSSAIFRGLLKSGYAANNIRITAQTAEKLHALNTELGVQYSLDNHQACRDADVVVLAVKPNKIKSVCEELREGVQQQKPLIVSVAAGVQCHSIQRWLGGYETVIRVMPNTPSLYQQGVSGVFATATVADEQRQLVTALLSSIGIVEWVDQEHLLDVVTAVSGSGPAYFFQLFEHMEKAAVTMGLAPDVARKMVLQTGLGALVMAQHSQLDPEELKRNVMSPNGTTEQAIKTFEAADQRAVVERAMLACVHRAQALSREFDED